MATQKSAKPTLSEWLDTVGVTARERETGSQALYDAIGTYNMIGLEEDNRDWKAIMSSSDPEQAAFQATAQAYGGGGAVNLTKTGGMLTSEDGIPLTSELGAYRQFGITLNPTSLLAQLNTISRATPAGRAKYDEINNLYQQALADQQASKSFDSSVNYILKNTPVTGQTAMASQTEANVNQNVGGGAANVAAQATAVASRPANVQRVFDLVVANPSIKDMDVVSAMKQYNVSPKEIADSFGLSEGQVISRVAATVQPNQSIILGDTRIVPQYQTIGSGMDQQIGGIENVYVEKVPTTDVNYKSPVGTPIQVYSPTGEFVNTIKIKEDQSFFGGLVDAFKDPYVQAALLGVAGGAGAFDGLLSGTASGAGTATGTGLGTGVTTGTGLTAGAGGITGLTAGTGLGTGITAGTGLTGTGILTGSGLGTTLLGTGAGALTGTGILSGSNLGTSILGTGAGTGVTGALTTGVGTGLDTGLGVGTGTGLGGLTTNQLGALLSGGLTTGAGLLQQQTSQEAAQRAQAMIDAETAIAKQAAQFRPVGMTTRFGTSQFQVDPRTGQLVSAGYTLSPEAKAAQDQFVKLAESGITQAKEAQQQFAPLQTGAQSLFNLGNQYLAQSPQEVAQNFLNQQLALLQPGRELELANLQNKLQQQGRGGLAVSQGGTYGATTPELQALYNARAMQEAQLAAQAQQAGQQQVAFGAGLLGTGAQTMGQYYGGQQAAYQPYTTALGQIQALETAGQQPLTMSASLAQQSAQAGANLGRLGLSGAEFSTRLATSPAATTNPYSTLLSGLGASPAFGQAIGGLFS